MVVEWTDSFICSKCNISRKVVKILEEGIDPDTKNPYQEMELECSHIQKRLRVSKEFTFRWNIKKVENLKVDRVITDGVPSLAVSGGSYTTIVGNAINIDVGEGAHYNTFNLNVINTTKTEGNINIVQNSAKTEVNISYNEILKEIDRDITNENEKQEIKNILQEIKNDLDSKRIPDSGLLHKLLQKLKRYEKIYYAVLPVVLKGIDFIKFFNNVK